MPRRTRSLQPGGRGQQEAGQESGELVAVCREHQESAPSILQTVPCAHEAQVPALGKGQGSGQQRPSSQSCSQWVLILGTRRASQVTEVGLRGRHGGQAGGSPELPGFGTQEQRSAVRILPAHLWSLTVVSAGWPGAPWWGALVLCTLTFRVWLSSRVSGEGTFASPPALAASESGGPSTQLAEAAPSAPWSPGSTGHLERLLLAPWRYGKCVSTQTRPSVLHGWPRHVFTAGLEVGRCCEEQVCPTSSVLLTCKVTRLSLPTSSPNDGELDGDEGNGAGAELTRFHGRLPGRETDHREGPESEEVAVASSHIGRSRHGHFETPQVKPQCPVGPPGTVSSGPNSPTPQSGAVRPAILSMTPPRQ